MLWGEFSGLNGMMLDSFCPPYDIHNLSGDYSETTIFAISTRRNPCDMKILMFKTIITLLNGDREITSNRQSSATDVIDESSTKEIKIPQKFKADVETLMKLYPSAFENKHGIVMTLKEAIEIIPRERVRTDSYKALQ